ncbi:SEC-C metal-binding domain-containing protein [Bacillus paranthracis]
MSANACCVILFHCYTYPNIYNPCACNSGKKYKFCCMNKEIELGI